VTILETERLTIREMDASIDAAYVNRLLNSPKFLKYIGDRGVRSEEQAAVFIEERYRQSYRDHGYGLYSVELKRTGEQVGMFGLVRRESGCLHRNHASASSRSQHQPKRSATRTISTICRTFLFAPRSITLPPRLATEM